MSDQGKRTMFWLSTIAFGCIGLSMVVFYTVALNAMGLSFLERILIYSPMSFGIGMSIVIIPVRMWRT